MIEKHFIEGCENLRKEGEGSDEILNWYRNLYYKEGLDTERGIVAMALNDILPELAQLRDTVKSLASEIELLEMKNQSLREVKDKSAATAMGVIKRQDLEIERLEHSVKQWEDTARDLFVGRQTAKDEVVKDFEEFARMAFDNPFACKYCAHSVEDGRACLWKLEHEDEGEACLGRHFEYRGKVEGNA